MKRVPLASILIVVCAPAVAQSYTISPDDVYTASEGPGFSNRFGGYRDLRYQYADSHLRGARSIRELSYRLDARVYTSVTGMGRRWQNVRIDMGECDYATMGRVFSNNATSTPTTVFSSAVRWPTRIGTPATRPDNWSMTFPFIGAWLFSGTRAVLVDYTFTGGTLLNNSTWTSTGLRPYNLDSFSYGSWCLGWPANLGSSSGAGGCVDSGSSSRNGAVDRMHAYTYGPTYSGSSYRSKFRVFAEGSYFPRSVSVVTALGFLANVPGVVFPGVTCNKIHIDLRSPIYLFPRRTTTSGTLSKFYFGSSNGLFNYDASWVGLDVVVQTAWNDTVSGSLKFGAAGWNSLSAVPPFADASSVGVRAAYSYSATSTTASFLETGIPTSAPIVRYGH